MVIALFVALFSIFPLTDTDIWWHLACAREWVTTWTPVRSPVVNVHEYFQLVVGFVYGFGGAPLLVAFKAVLWAAVFGLFLRFRLGRKSLPKISAALVLLFLFRYHFEIRPVLFTLLFLGIYWNLLPKLFRGWSAPARTSCRASRETVLNAAAVLAVLLIQWVWCKCQGLYILGPLFAALTLGSTIFETWKKKEKKDVKGLVLQVVLVTLLFAAPFMHREGLSLFLYPFGLLDRLLGLTSSAVVFAKEIAENRSPLTLLMAGENVLESVLMIVLCLVGFFLSVKRMTLRATEGSEAISSSIREIQCVALFVTSILALIAERNFVLFLPVLFNSICSKTNHQPLDSEFRNLNISSLSSQRAKPDFKHQSIFGSRRSPHSLRDDEPSLCPLPTAHCLLPIANSRLSTVYCLLPIVFLLGFWARSLSAYDYSMVAYQRVPVDAAQWMLKNPHRGRLFNDDRAGGYLAFVNPADSVYIDGRFILKTADFFERYLNYAEDASSFMADADSLNIDRAVFPLRYYARWNNLIEALDKSPRWNLVYRDDYFAVFDKK